MPLNYHYANRHSKNLFCEYFPPVTWLITMFCGITLYFQMQDSDVRITHLSELSLGDSRDLSLNHFENVSKCAHSERHPKI